MPRSALLAVATILGASSVRGFVSPAATRVTSSLQMSSAVDASPFPKSDRVVLDELPIIYAYDHCPFCVRVRLAFGVKNIKHKVVFMANDDIPTPTKLVGKKIAPIFELPSDDLIMAESLDIVEKVDSDERFGPTGVIKPASGRKDIKAWQKSVQTLLRTLQRPRYVATGLLPEFQQEDGRIAFINNHQLPPYEKDEWKKGDMPIQDKIKLYDDAFQTDVTPMVDELNTKLKELDDMVFSEHYCTEGGFCLDDIDLWARLRSITIVKGVQWPDKLRKYMDSLSALGDVPLYDEMAM